MPVSIRSTLDTADSKGTTPAVAASGLTRR